MFDITYDMLLMSIVSTCWTWTHERKCRNIGSNIWK